ncbi:YkgJ family cysteine cluster protein [bacterium]|nr:YkgJ family cysteine cluster protein [bacterium]
MFKKQAPFIKCKKGCVHCCSDGEYPMSELEFINIMLEYMKLDAEKRSKVDKNIKELLNKDNPYSYTCPFLLNGECSVYPARALICRAFGLITFFKNERKKIPFCVSMGLNYSDVYCEQTSEIEENAPDGTEAKAYNVDRRTLRCKDIEESFDIFFGEDKNLYDWLKENFGKECPILWS